MRLKSYRVRIMIAESLVITGPNDFDVIMVIVHAYNEDQAIDVGKQIIGKDFPGLIVLSTEIEPMFN
jgi:hypothetical protein